MSPLALESLLETAGAHIDLIKLGWGTAYVSKGVREKVELCRQAGVRICPGGTLLEIAVHQGCLDRYAEWLRELGIDHVEVSNGSLPISPAQKREIIAELAAEFTVIAEVGSKTSKPAVASTWVEEMLNDLAAGAVWVIGEGRESGTVGLFDDHGDVHADLVDAIVRRARPRDGHLRGAAPVAADVAAAPPRAERQPRQRARLRRDRARDAAPRPALRHARSAARARQLDELILGPPPRRPRDLRPAPGLGHGRPALGEHRVHRLGRGAARHGAGGERGGRVERRGVDPERGRVEAPAGDGAADRVVGRAVVAAGAQADRLGDVRGQGEAVADALRRPAPRRP